MVYCNFCKCETDIEVDDANGFSCCVQCGSVLEDIAFSADITFQKDAAGDSTVVGQFVNESGVARGIGRIHGGRVYAYQADSHERSQQRGRQDISHLVDILSVRPREESIESSHRLYKLALQRGFTRGRRTNQVAAACLYLVCRQDNKPFLLIDLSDALQVNIFTLGAVFLQLAKLLRLEEHPLFSKPVDPSLYIHRFADRLGFPSHEDMRKVALTAMRLVASMKRDWIQTGRRPSGICGAALYIAAHTHGFRRTKRDVVGVVHIGEHTLAKRLSEFAATDAAMLTASDFEVRAKEIEAREVAALEAAPAAARPTAMLTGCEHLGQGGEHFAHGMCRACYADFVKISGGLHDGAHPPAFARARAKEAKQALLALEGAPEDEEQGEEDDEGPALASCSSVLMIEGPSEGAAAGGGGAEEEEAGGSRRSTRGKKRRKEPEPVATAPAAKRRGGGAEKKAVDVGGKGDAVSAAAVAAAEAEVSAFTAAIEEAETAEAARPSRRRGAGSKAFLAAVLAASVADAAREVGGVGAEEAAAAAGAIIPVAGGAAPLPVATTADFEGGQGAEGQPEAEGNEAGAIVPAAAAAVAAAAVAAAEADNDNDDGNLSEFSDTEIGLYLADTAEVACKEEIWNMMNQDWVEKQVAKRAALEAAERAQAEQRAAMEAAAAAGVQYKRGRGRPLGSKTKPKPELDLPPAETPQEAAMRMLDHKKLSSKINYSVLADLFADDPQAAAAAQAAASGGSGGGAGASEAAAAAGRSHPPATQQPAGLAQAQPASPTRRRPHQRKQQQAEAVPERPPPRGAAAAPAAAEPAVTAAGGGPRKRLGGLRAPLGSLKDTAFKGGLGRGGMNAPPAGKKPAASKGAGSGASKKVRFSEGTSLKGK